MRAAAMNQGRAALTRLQIASVTAGNGLEFYDFVTYAFFATQIGRTLFPGDADRSLLLFGATTLVTPYAMNYELALFAPGVAVYLSRLRDPRWTRYVAAAFGYVLLPWAFPTVLPALALPIASLLRPGLARDDAEIDASSNPPR